MVNMSDMANQLICRICLICLPWQVMLHRWMLDSPYRTLNASTADYFFVPLYMSLGNYDFEFGYYGVSQRGFAMMHDVGI